MTNWLYPSVLASLVGTVVLAGTFFLLNRAEKKPYLAVWAAGWCFYAVRFAFMLLFLGSPGGAWRSGFLIMNQLCSLMSGIFLLWGTTIYLKRKFSRRWWALTALSGGYTVVWGVEFTDSFIGSLPVFWFLGAIYIWTGIIVIRNKTDARRFQLLLGVLFIIWGVHKMDYPLLRDMPLAAPLGYLLGAVMELSVSIVMVLAFFQNLIAEKESSDTQYRLIVENQNELILKLNCSLQILYASPSFCALVRQTDDEVLGVDFLNFLHLKNKTDIRDSLRNLCQYSEILQFDEQVSDVAPERWISWAVNPIENAQAQATELIAVGRDVSPQIRAQQALERERYFLRRAQELGHIGTWELDVKNNVLEWTEENYRIFGIPRGTPLTFDSFFSCVHPEDRAYVMEMWHQGTQTGMYDIEHRIIREEEVRWIREKAEIQFDERGECTSAIGFSMDITGAKRAQQTHETLNQQLLRVQKMESVGALAGGIAHDFNNMLGVIIGNIELATEELPAEGSLHARLNDARDAAERSASLTRQLLGFARQQTIRPKVLDLNDTIEQMLKVLRRLAGEEIHVAWKPTQGLWNVKMDPSQIDQIMTNLCANARDAIQGTGTITIETYNFSADEDYCNDRQGLAVGDYVMLKMADSGIGMDEETRNNLFDPFFTTKELGKGTGLGLSTVYGIVMQNNGHIRVESDPGMGATFFVYFPRHTQKQEAVADAADETAFPRGAEHILLVEDDTMMRNIINKMLSRLGYRVTALSNPTAALSMLQSDAEQFELLITDVIMPTMSGKDLAEKIEAMRPGMRRLFISGYPADIVSKRGVLEEGVHFLSKPFTRSILAKKVRHILDGRE